LHRILLGIIQRRCSFGQRVCLNDTHCEIKLSIFLFLLGSLMSLSSGANAQSCPPDGWEGCIWTGPTVSTYTLAGGCQVEVTYCTGCVGSDFPKIFISSVRPLTSGCDVIPGDQLIKQAVDAVFSDPSVATALNVPPCVVKGGTFYGKTVGVLVSFCWKYTYWGDIFGIPAYFYLPCSFEVCEKWCRMCFSGGVVVVQDCHWETHGTTNCNPPPSGTWERDVCYDIAPCAH
jgi:hypothetical protein